MKLVCFDAHNRPRQDAWPSPSWYYYTRGTLMLPSHYVGKPAKSLISLDCHVAIMVIMRHSIC